MSDSAKILMRVTDNGEVMVTMPSGEIKFMGYVESIKFGLSAIRQGYEVQVDKDNTERPKSNIAQWYEKWNFDYFSYLLGLALGCSAHYIAHIFCKLLLGID